LIILFYRSILDPIAIEAGECIRNWVNAKLFYSDYFEYISPDKRKISISDCRLLPLLASAIFRNILLGRPTPPGPFHYLAGPVQVNNISLIGGPGELKKSGPPTHWEHCHGPTYCGSSQHKSTAPSFSNHSLPNSAPIHPFVEPSHLSFILFPATPSNRKTLKTQAQRNRPKFIEGTGQKWANPLAQRGYSPWTIYILDKVIGAF
jgi:hypothetical protein